MGGSTEIKKMQKKTRGGLWHVTVISLLWPRQLSRLDSRLCPILCPPPNPTECYPVAARRDKPLWMLRLSHLVAIRSVPCNLLILRATNLCKQGVTGSIPVTSTNFIVDRKVLTEFICQSSRAY